LVSLASNCSPVIVIGNETQLHCSTQLAWSMLVAVEVRVSSYAFVARQGTKEHVRDQLEPMTNVCCELIYKPTNALNKIQFMTNIYLLHFLAWAG
jgi:hypothetical protein